MMLSLYAKRLTKGLHDRLLAASGSDGDRRTREHVTSRALYPTHGSRVRHREAELKLSTVSGDGRWWAMRLDRVIRAWPTSLILPT